MQVLLSAAMVAATLSAASGAETCDQWGQTKSGDYIIYNNLWGSSAATEGGKQCTGLDSASGDTIAWHSTWTWNGGNTSVKSFANVALTFDAAPLTKVTSIPSSIDLEVKYSGTIMANVVYDLFTSSKPDGEKEFQVTVWLASIGGVGPISSTGKPIKEGVEIEGMKWDLYSGMNGQMTVYSFLPPAPVDSLDGDLLAFFTYLKKNHKFDMSQYLIKLKCGTGPFFGTDVTLKVSKYSAAVKTGESGSSSPVQSSLDDSPVSQEDEKASKEVGAEARSNVDSTGELEGTSSPDDEVTESEDKTADSALSPTVETPILKSKCVLRGD